MSGKLRLPGTTTATRTANTPLVRELLYDTDENKVYLGDGATSGGVELGVSGAYSTFEDDGTPVTQRTTANFTGVGVTVTDSGGKTVINIPGGGGLNWQVTAITATPLAAVAGNGYFLDTSSNSIEVDFPGSPTVGDEIGIVTVDNTNATTFDPQTLKILSSTGVNSTIQTYQKRQVFVYTGTIQGWVPIFDELTEYIKIKLQTITIGAPQASVQFSSISGSYDKLVVELRNLKCDIADNTVNIAFNSDTTASNYRRQLLQGVSSTASASLSTTRNFLFCLRSTDTSNDSLNLLLNIANYADTGKYSHLDFKGGFSTPSGGGSYVIVGQWANTAAITTIDLTPTSGNFDAGSAILWGIKG